MRGPVVPGALLVKAPVAVGHQCSRFSDQDVRDLLDGLFVPTVDPTVTMAPVASTNDIIRSKPFLRSAVPPELLVLVLLLFNRRHRRGDLSFSALLPIYALTDHAERTSATVRCDDY